MLKVMISKSTIGVLEGVMKKRILSEIGVAKYLCDPKGFPIVFEDCEVLR